MTKTTGVNLVDVVTEGAVKAPDSNMSKMFVGMSVLTALDVSNFNTSNVTDMKYMFAI